MWKLIGFGFLFGLAAVDVQAATPVDAKAAKAMNALFAKRHKADAPGCVAGVYRNGEILNTSAYGMANLELGVPLSAKSVLDIGSTSKQFTALSALLLERDGKLSLDDDIRKYVPELPEYASRITLRQLLQHTGGVRDYIDLLRMHGNHVDDVTTAADALRVISQQSGTHFAPGEEYEYSNSGYFLVGLAIEKASGQSLRKFAQQRIFAPLGMTSTVYRDDHTELVPNRAMAYAKDEKKGWVLDVSNWEQMGDGGIVTTVGDFARWNANFYEPKVGDAALFKLQEAPLLLKGGVSVPYGLGLIPGTYKGHATVEHGGSWGGYRANFKRFPARRLAVALMCNGEDANLGELINQVSDLYLPSASKATTAPADPSVAAANWSQDQLEAWVGAYLFGINGKVEIRRVDKALQVVTEDETYALVPLSDGTVKVGGVPVDVILRRMPAADGEPRRIQQFNNGVPSGMAVRYTPSQPTSQELQAQVGNFHCPEIQADYQVQLDNGELKLLTPRGDRISMTPYGAGYYAGRRFGLRYPAASDRPAQEMQLSMSRARDVRCRRL